MQVTELRCGGMVVGCAFDHRAADAYSFFIFMSAWANVALNKPIDKLPSFYQFPHSSRIISPSNSFDPIFDRIFTPLSLPPPSNPVIPADAPVNRIYYISAVDIARLQEIVGNNRSKLICFTAYFWKLLARSACQGEKSCSMGLLVDGRAFMSNIHGNNFMKNYFGNVLSVPFGNLQVERLHDMNLAEVAEEVHKWLSPATTEDHFLGLHEWVEAHRPEPLVTTLYYEDSKGEEKSNSCVVSSGRSFPEIDFGWGKAAFWSAHFSRGPKGGYLFPMQRSDTGDWVVYAQVAPTIIAAMEKNPTIFRPFRISSRARL